MKHIVGINVGKDSLVVRRLPGNATIEVENDKTGLNTFLRWLGRDETLHVVFEPTGPYHRLWERTPAAADIAIIKVNPRQARRLGHWSTCKDGSVRCGHAGASGSNA